MVITRHGNFQKFNTAAIREKKRDSISDIGPGGVASALSKIQRAITKPLNPRR